MKACELKWQMNSLWSVWVQYAAHAAPETVWSKIIVLHTTQYQFGLILFYNTFLQAFIWSEYSKNCVILLQFKIAVLYMNLLKCNWLLWCAAEFSASLLQCHMIFRNHSNMMICCPRNISDYYQCWKQMCCPIFLWKLWYISIQK